MKVFLFIVLLTMDRSGDIETKNRIIEAESVEQCHSMQKEVDLEYKNNLSKKKRTVGYIAKCFAQK